MQGLRRLVLLPSVDGQAVSTAFESGLVAVDRVSTWWRNEEQYCLLPGPAQCRSLNNGDPGSLGLLSEAIVSRRVFGDPKVRRPSTQAVLRLRNGRALARAA